TSELHVYPVKGTADCASATIEDPEALITCDNLTIDWMNKGGSASNIVLKAGGATIKAATANIAGKTWKLNDVSGTTSRRAHPLYSVHAREVELVPGKGGVARRVIFEIFGLPIGPLPISSFNLDRRVTGLKIPDIANRRGVGFGVSWSSAILLDDHTAALGSFGAFPRQSTSYGLQIARSKLDPSTQGSAIVPRFDLGEYAETGWFDNLIVRHPDEERDMLRADRDSFGIGTVWNAGTSGRDPDSSDVSKALEVAIEKGGRKGPFGYSLTGRVQRIRGSANDSWVDRGLLDGTIGMPTIAITPNLGIISRLDFRATAGNRGSYSFGRAEAGLAWTPFEGFAAGIGAAYSVSAGTPDFAFDPMPFPKSFMVRFDYRRGFLTLRYLNKYDPVSKTWYDREYEIAVVADGFEPYIASRTFPSDFRIGLRFRLDQFVSRLLDRDIKRQPKK
ncbi:MAG: hypothetical protein ABUL72_05135, partial [Armatimonadota bacterium]